MIMYKETFVKAIRPIVHPIGVNNVAMVYDASLVCKVI